MMEGPAAALEPSSGHGPVDPFEPTIGLLGIIRILFRWSYVVAPLVALTVWVALSQSQDIQPEYKAEASLLLLGPSEVLIEDLETGEIDVTNVNPLQQLGGTLNTVARVTVLAMSDVRVTEQLVAEGFTDQFAIGVESRIPIIRLEAIHQDKELANATVERLTQMIFDDLTNRQDALNAPESNRVGAQLISSGVGGGPDFGARTRVRLAIAGVGFALSVASAFFLEGLAQLWRRRKARRAAELAKPPQRALPSGAPPLDRLAAHRVTSAKELVESERETLAAVLHMVTGNEALGEAIAAESGAAAIEEWVAIEHGEPVEWLYGHGIRQAWAQPEHEITAHPDDAALWEAVQDLPDDTRAVLALASIADFTDPRIAGALDLKASTVAAHRAIASDALAVLPATTKIDASLRSHTRSSAVATSHIDEPGDDAGESPDDDVNPMSGEGAPVPDRAPTRNQTRRPRAKKSVAKKAAMNRSPRLVANQSSAPKKVVNKTSAPNAAASQSGEPNVAATESSAPKAVANQSSAQKTAASESTAQPSEPARTPTTPPHPKVES